MTPAVKVALYGARGAGKSTFGLVALQVLGADKCHIIHSAAPLYALQAEVYAAAGATISADQQDGHLLKVLASEIRRLNPAALARTVGEKALEISLDSSSLKLILCDDSLPADRATLQEMGFVFVHIASPSQVRSSRRIERGDIDPAQDDNDPIVDIVDPNDQSIINAGSLADYRRQITSTLRALGVE